MWVFRFFGIALLAYILFFLSLFAFSDCASTETRVLDKYHPCGGPNEPRCRLRAFQAQPWECCK